MTNRQVVLCADDYGQNPSISAGILSLAGRGRLSAVSCMSNAGHWPEAAAEMLKVAPDIDTGLHFTLTGTATGFRSTPGADRGPALSALIRDAYLRRLDKTGVIKALNSQLDLFQQHLGRLPDFIDGHQHVHQLPVVRDALLSVCKTRLKSDRFFVRSLAHISGRQYAFFKSLIIQSLGARVLERTLDRNNISHNPGFAGIYDFSAPDYRGCMLEWLGNAADGTLIMCHPGHRSEDPDDPIRHGREIEYRYLGSDVFLEDCRNLNISLVRGTVAYRHVLARAHT